MDIDQHEVWLRRVNNFESLYAGRGLSNQSKGLRCIEEGSGRRPRQKAIVDYYNSVDLAIAHDL
jgi:hypothetical protein